MYYNPADPTSYPGVGSVLTDLSGSNNDATSTNVPAWNTDGWFNYAAGGHWSVPYSTTMSPTAGVTISVWAQLPNWTTPSNVRLISRTEGGGWHISVNESPGQMNALIMIAGGYRFQQIPVASIKPGWNNFVITYNGSIYKFIVNGKVERQTNIVGTVTYPSCNNPTIIGREATCSTPTGPAFLGSIGETIVYNRGLTDAEVLTNYNNTKAKYSDS